MPSPRSMTSSCWLTEPMSANGCQKRVVAVCTAMAEDGIALRSHASVQRSKSARASAAERERHVAGERDRRVEHDAALEVADQEDEPAAVGAALAYSGAAAWTR